jgi:hypothetical protein
LVVLRESAQQLLRPDIAFVMEIAVATLGNFHAKPFGHGKAGQANVGQTLRAGIKEKRWEQQLDTYKIQKKQLL